MGWATAAYYFLSIRVPYEGDVRLLLFPLFSLFLSTASADVNTVAGSTSSTPTNGFTDASGYSARFNQPVGIAAYTSGGVTYLFVADTSNSAIRLITVTSSCEWIRTSRVLWLLDLALWGWHVGFCLVAFLHFFSFSHCAGVSMILLCFVYKPNRPQNRRFVRGFYVCRVHFCRVHKRHRGDDQLCCHFFGLFPSFQPTAGGALRRNLTLHRQMCIV